MNETQIKNRAKLAVKRALEGDITSQDLLAIVKLQVPELQNNTDVAAAYMIMVQVAFN
jgi:hypothetical protein